MRLASLLAPVVLMLAACAAPAPNDTHAGHPAPAGSASAPAREALLPSRDEATAPRAGAPAPQPAPTREDAPRTAAPAPATPVAGGDASAVNRSCRTDADCVVKDVGNCCGYFPACVNVNATTNPAAVKAQCEASGMASTCGFAEISACTCTAGQCTAAGPNAPVAR